MSFNIFTVFLVVVGFLNFSVDLIQRDRFRREREVAMASGDKGKRHLGCEEDQKEEKRSVMKKLRMMFEYNQLSFVYCLALFLSLFLMEMVIGITAIYAFLPHTRDPTSGLFEDPILKFAESIYLYDWMHCYKRSRHYNYNLIIMLIQYMSIKLLNIKRVYETSWINRREYKRINVIQLDFGYLEELQLDLWSWFQLMFHKGKHDCKMPATLYDEKSCVVKQLFYRVDKLDRLYYYNVLDFDDCYRDLNIKVHDGVEEDKQPIEYSQVSWRLWLLSYRLPRFRFQVTTPLHRIDRNDLAILAIFNALGVVFMVSVFLFAFIITTWATLKHNSVEMSNFTRMLDQIMASPKLYMSITISFICLCVIAAALADNGILVLCSISLVSRAKKIKRMLNYESGICHQHLFEFSNHMVARKAQTNNINLEQNIRFVTHESKKDRGSLSQCATISPQNFLHYSKYGMESANYEQLVRQYKDEMIKANRGVDIKLLNEHLNYLIDLISHLRNEQEDIKRFFTARLNINVVTGTLGITIALSEWMKADTLDEQILVYLFVTALVLPMFLALFVGAASEAATRQIYRSLEPLMANDLRLVETDMIKKMQRVYVHLTRAENRGFILLGNLSLNFGSLVTIFGTIGSFFILREKQERYTYL